MTDLLTAALAWHDTGATVLPAATDGTKMPALPWKQYQTHPPTREQIETWFTNTHRTGLGVVCGTVSGNLEMLELEGRAVNNGAVPELAEAVAAAGLGNLWEQVTTGGYAERTPSGGLHLLYRITDEPVPGNLKLARQPGPPDPEGRPTVEVLAETRGEGGWTVIAPSNGTTHPTGEPWTVLFGGPEKVPTITAAQRHQLHRIVRTLDRMPTPEPAEQATPRLRLVDPAGGTTPGDDFEARVDWADELLLGGAGWKLLTGQPGGYRTWKRPGKDTPGLSATTGRAPDRDRLYVMSSSAHPFDQEIPYTKFGAYALLHHKGDHSAAARELRRLGYGTPSPEPAHIQAEMIADLMPTAAPPPPRPRLEVVDGATALATEPEHVTINWDDYGSTEDGLARALIAAHGNNLRYCPQRGKWLGWTGHTWEWDDAEWHRELIKTMARTLPDTDRDWRTFAHRAESAAGVSGIERQARSDRAVVTHFDSLDADPWVLNTPNGIVDLRTGQMRPSDPGALCTRSTKVPLDPDAAPGRWQEFLADTFGEDTELVAYLQRLVGYSAIGMIGPHVLPFAFGSGGNGKGVFLEALTGVLGDYATTAPVGFLMTQTHQSHETEIARLAGARMVVCSEVNEGDRFDEAKVKQLTGGDTLTARFMRQDHFTFTPTHQLWLMGNHQPEVRTGGRSFWRRLRLIPFEHEVPDEKIVDDLQGLLVREHGPALLSWIVAGAVAYAQGGLREPERVKAATAEYAHDQDSVAKFVEEQCVRGGGDHVRIKTSKVREDYERWCYASGETPVSAKALTIALRNRFGIQSTRDMSARFYVGLALVSAEEAPWDAS